MCPEVVKEEVAALVKRGASLEMVEEANHCYVLASGRAAPTPTWNQNCYDILVAIPAAYDAASLDSFYLALPYTFKGGSHPRVQGTVITVKNRQWQLVSWHY